MSTATATVTAPATATVDAAKAEAVRLQQAARQLAIKEALAVCEICRDGRGNKSLKFQNQDLAILALAVVLKSPSTYNGAQFYMPVKQKDRGEEVKIAAFAVNVAAALRCYAGMTTTVSGAWKMA